MPDVPALQGESEVDERQIMHNVIYIIVRIKVGRISGGGEKKGLGADCKKGVNDINKIGFGTN